MACEEEKEGKHEAHYMPLHAIVSYMYMYICSVRACIHVCVCVCVCVCVYGYVVRANDMHGGKM